MPAKKLIVALLIIIVAVGGFVAGLFLLRENQTLTEEAAVPNGQAEVSVQPATGNYNVGDTINTSVYFNPANIPVSGIAVRLTYPYSGTTPEVTTDSQSIEISNAITSSGDWTCPTKSVSQQGSNVAIEIACVNQGAAGFVANSDTLLANIKLRVARQPQIQPLVLRFDPAVSRITRKSDNVDILLIPTSTGSYTVGGGATTAPTATIAPTVSVTTTPTTTPRLTTTVTVTPTEADGIGGGDEEATPSGTTTKGGETLPDAGVSYPTLFGVGLGVMVIVGVLLMAI